MVLFSAVWCAVEPVLCDVVRMVPVGCDLVHHGAVPCSLVRGGTCSVRCGAHGACWVRPSASWCCSVQSGARWSLYSSVRWTDDTDNQKTCPVSQGLGSLADIQIALESQNGGAAFGSYAE